MIEADFKVLQSEFKKKNPQVRESVDNALLWLTQVKQQQQAAGAASSDKIRNQPVEILEPLRLMFEQKLTKTYAMAMNLLQKITQVFSTADHGTVLLILDILKEASIEILDEMTEIRILQLLLTFLDPHSIQPSRQFVSLVMQSCFQMMDTKSLAVKSTIQATLKQLFTLVLERFVENCKETIPLDKHRDIFSTKKHGVQLSPAEFAEIADMLRVRFQSGDSIYHVVKELVQNLTFSVLMFDSKQSKKVTFIGSAAAAQQQPSSEGFLNFKPSVYANSIVLDLINLCLTMTNETFRFLPEIVSIFELQMAPTIEPLLDHKSASSGSQSAFGMRLMKCATLIINNLGVGVNLLRTILSDAEAFTHTSRDGAISVNLSWKCLIAFECLQIVVSNPCLTELFANSSLSIGAPVLIQIIECYIAAAKAIEQSKDVQINAGGSSISRSSQRGLYQSTQKINKVINSQNLDGEIGAPTFVQMQRIMIESICTFADNFVFVFSAIGIKLGTPSENRGKNRETEESPSMIKCKRMLTLCWKPLLEVLQKLIRTTPDESNIQMLLKAFQSCIGACGSANCYQARDAFLQALCDECVTVSVKGDASSSGAHNASLNQSQRESQTGRKSLAAINVKPTVANATEDQLTITERNIPICKTFFNIAHCLCHILDVKSWFLILETMQKIENVINKKLQVHGLVARKDRPTFNQDGNQLIINFEELKKKVEHKMVRFNIVERHQNFEKRPGHHSRLSISGNIAITAASRPSFSMLQQPTGGQPAQEDERLSITGAQLPQITLPPSSIMIQPQLRTVASGGGNPFEEAKEATGIRQANQTATIVDPLINELHMLQESFDSLFTSTLLFDMQSLAELICALAQLTVGVLEHFHSPMFSNPNARVSTESEILAQINTFAMSRLVETALVNVSRIDNIWKIIVAHFDILSNCQVLAIRQLTIEALQTIVLAIFAHKKTLQPSMALTKIQSQTYTSVGLKVDSKQNSQENVTDDDVSMEEGKNDSEIASEHESSCDNSFRSAQENSNDSSSFSKAVSVDDKKRRRGKAKGDESWQNSTWQYTVLVPLAEQLKSNHNSDKLAVIKGFERIIQMCGQQIKNEGWRIIIVTISKSLEHESDQIVACGFRCLKLVVSNYINRLSQQNFVTVLNAIHMYASNGGSNINNNLIAIGMFQNVADFTASQITQAGTAKQKVPTESPRSEGLNTSSLSSVQQKAAVINFEKIWQILFERIHSLGSNKRAEVRKASVHTLENIIMTHGSSLQVSHVWPQVLNETVLGMLKGCVERYSQGTSTQITRDSKGLLEPSSSAATTVGRPSDGLIAPTPTFFGVSQIQGKAQPKMQFDDATVTKALRQNDSQWEETCTLLVQTACRSLKKFFAVSKDKASTQKKVWEMAQEFWVELTDCMSLMLSVGSSDVCLFIFKALLTFLADNDCQRLFLQSEEETRMFLSAVVDYLGVEQENFQAQKTERNKTIKLLKICPIVIETLSKLYNKQTLAQLEQMPSTQGGNDVLKKVISKDFCANILLLLEQVVSTSKAAESLQSFGTNKLLSEERTVFDFIETLNDFYILNSESQALYVDFLFRFTEFTGQQRQEAFIKRGFSIIYSALLRGRIKKSIVKDLVPRLIERMKDLINLRYDNQACMTLVFQAKGSQALFLTSGLYMIHITSFLINPQQFKARLQIHGAQMSENRLGVQAAIPSTQVTTPATNQSQQNQETGGTGNQKQVKRNQAHEVQSLMLAPGSANERDLLFAENLEFQPCAASEVRPEEYTDLDTRQLVWEQVMEALQTTILFDQARIADHNKAVISEVMKGSQELDMQAMNFILNCLLPNSTLSGQQSSEAQKMLEQTLVQIIDRGCGNQPAGSSSSQTANLSRYCFNNMFELCRYQHLAPVVDVAQPVGQGSPTNEAFQTSLSEIKLKIARIATPILINRCKQTLKRFIKDEQKVGSVGLSKSRISEVVFILDKLRDLDCYPTNQMQRLSNASVGNQRLSNTSMSGGNFKKSHLIELMPILSELILRNEHPIKESLRFIFLEISSALNDNMKAVQEAMMQAQPDFVIASAGGVDFENRVSTGGAAEEDGNRGSSGGD